MKPGSWGRGVALPLVPALLRVPSDVPSIPGPQLTPRWQLPGLCPEHGSGRGDEGASPGIGRQGTGDRGPHSPMRLKLSDKVLLNFFILPIFSLGCGSMRSHIWAARGPGNFAKLVQRAAQTTAAGEGARRGEGGASSCSSASSRSAGDAQRSGGWPPRGSGLGRGRARGGVLGGAGGGRRPRRPGAPAPRRRRRPPHLPSFVSESRAAAAGAGWVGGAAEESGRPRETRAGQVPSPGRGAARRSSAPPVAGGLARGTPARPRSASDSEASAALPDPPRPLPAARAPPAAAALLPRAPPPRPADGRTDGQAGLRAHPAHPVRSVRHPGTDSWGGSEPGLAGRPRGPVGV